MHDHLGSLLIFAAIALLAALYAIPSTRRALTRKDDQ